MFKSIFDPKNSNKLHFHSNSRRICLIFFISFFLFSLFFLAKAQSEIYFTSEKLFAMPQNNSSFRFDTGGSYKSANYENGVWTFKELYINNSTATEKLNLKLSATDCDLRIYPYRITPYTYGKETLKWVIIRYTISGQGTQTINLGVNTNNGQLDVILDGEFIGRNQGWTKSKDGTLTITGAKENVRLWYIGYPDYLEESNDFLNQHSLLIGSISFFSIIIILAAFIGYRKKEEN